MDVDVWEDVFTRVYVPKALGGFSLYIPPLVSLARGFTQCRVDCPGEPEARFRNH